MATAAVRAAFLASLLLFLLSACTATGNGRKQAIPEETANLEALVQLPEKVRKLSIKQRKVYDDPAAGVQYRYGGNLVYFVDVFVYPVKDAQKALLIESDERNLISDEFNHFRAELGYAVEQGWYQAVEPVEELLQRWGFEFSNDGVPHDAPFLVAQGEYRIQKDDRQLASFVTLSEFNGYFVKIRLTHPEYPGLGEESRTFAEILFKELYRTQTQLPSISFKKDGTKTTMNCLPGESLLECMSRGVRSTVDGAPNAIENAGETL